MPFINCFIFSPLLASARSAVVQTKAGSGARTVTEFESFCLRIAARRREGSDADANVRTAETIRSCVQPSSLDNSSKMGKKEIR
jgi:hypothetical protein